MATAPAERKRQQRARQQAAGLKRVELLIHPDDEAKLRLEAAKLNSKRLDK